MKKLKIAGYQGDGSVHTRSVNFFIDKVSDYFDISFDQDITEKGQKAASLIEMTMNNEIQMSYLWSSYYEKYIPEIKLLDLPFYFKNKNEVKNLININLQPFVSNELIKRYSFGGAAVNDTISQIVNHRLPFGGIRNSGLGSYHGKQSFKTFSFYKPYIVKSNIFDLNAKYKIDSSSFIYKLLKRVVKKISL